MGRNGFEVPNIVGCDEWAWRHREKENLSVHELGAALDVRINVKMFELMHSDIAIPNAKYYNILRINTQNYYITV